MKDGTGRLGRTAVARGLAVLALASAFLVSAPAAAQAQTWAPAFTDDFANAGRRGDPEWTTLRGSWRGTRAPKRLTGNVRALDLAAVTGVALPATQTHRAEVKLRLTGATRRPNAGLAFAIQDRDNYLAVTATPRGLQLVQRGAFTGSAAGVKKTVRQRFRLNRWYRLSVVWTPGGEVSVFVGDAATPALSHSLGGMWGGGAGLVSIKTGAFFDDYALAAATTPAVPEKFLVLNRPDRVELGWEAASAPLYRVYRCPTNALVQCGAVAAAECGAPLVETAGTAHTETGLGALEAYCYAVQACNEYNCSALSRAQAGHLQPDPVLSLLVTAPESVLEGTEARLLVKARDAQGPVRNYEWRQTEGYYVTLSGGETDTMSFTAPPVTDDTTLKFAVRAFDGKAEATAEASVLVRPDHIYVDAGEDAAAEAGQVVSLHAHGAGDEPDPANDTYAWTQVAPGGPTVVLTGGDTANPTFTAPTVKISTTLVFEVVFNDGARSTSDRVRVKVREAAPASQANAPLTVSGAKQRTPLRVVAPPAAFVPDEHVERLVAVVGGGDGAYKFQWKYKGKAGPGADPALAGEDTATLRVDLPAVSGDTTYAFHVTVEDGKGEFADDSTTLFVSPGAPSTDPPLWVFAPTAAGGEGPKPITLSATGLGGTPPYTFAWRQTGPELPGGGLDPALTVVLQNPNGEIATFLPPAVESDKVLSFELVAVDATGQTQTRNVSALVTNAFALHLPQKLRLQGFAGPVEIVGGTRRALAAPPTIGGTPPFQWEWRDASAPGTVLSNDPVLDLSPVPVAVEETRTLEVTVTDSGVGTATATVQVRILPLPTAPAPLAVAGPPDLHVDEGGTIYVPLQITGGTGEIVNYAWSYAPAPGDPELSTAGASSSVLTLTAPQVSARTTVTLGIAVRDSAGQVATAVIPLTIVDNTPVADLSLGTPEGKTVGAGHEVHLNGGTPAGGTPPYAYAWVQTDTSGQVVTLAGGTTNNPSFTAPAVSAETVLTFRMTVTDAAAPQPNTISVDESVTVRPPPVGPAARPLAVSLDLGAWHGAGVQSIFTASGSGGAGGYTCTWTATPDVKQRMGDGGDGPSISTLSACTVTVNLPRNDPDGDGVSDPYELTVHVDLTDGTDKVSREGKGTVANQTCFTCGDYDADPKVECSRLEMLTKHKEVCPDGKPYCMNDVFQPVGETPKLYKRCVDQDAVDNDWYHATSDKAACIAYNNGNTYRDPLVCHLGCSGTIQAGMTFRDESPLIESDIGLPCNANILPPVQTLYQP